MTGWPVDTAAGTAAELHAASAALVESGRRPARSARVLAATDRCVVLGSAQPDSAADPGRLRDAGLGLARRRSGGSAVLVGPGEVVWLDVVVPRGDPAWEDDVGRAAWWLGERWSAALEAAGWRGAQVWRGAMRRSALSSAVCFAGLGQGEVTVGERKVVGISQRRTREAILLQSALLVRWEPDELVSVLRLTPRQEEMARDLGRLAVGVGEEAAAAALEAVLAGLAARVAREGGPGAPSGAGDIISARGKDGDDRS